MYNYSLRNKGMFNKYVLLVVHILIATFTLYFSSTCSIT